VSERKGSVEYLITFLIGAKKPKKVSKFLTVFENSFLSFDEDFMKLFFSLLLCFSLSLYVQTEEELVRAINAKSILLFNSRGSTKIIKKVDGGQNGQDIEFLSGVPIWTKVLEVSEGRVFRHYTLSAQEINLKQKTLKAGPRPYVLPKPHLRQEFVV
jgi:hypothetical protein